MTATPSPTWWEEHDAHLRELAANPIGQWADPTDQWADPDPPFSGALLALLTEVESAFVRTGADTPPWPDPHLDPDGEMRDSSEEEYSRCLEPGKYRILGSRVEAWTEALTARGWATREDVVTGDLRSGIRWAIPPPLALHRTTVLRPRRPGAQPLILARTAPDDAEASPDLVGEETRIPGLIIGIGEPVELVSTVPDCGCDACDSGSQDLLEDFDRALLSIVDGSFEVTRTPHGYSTRTSFGTESGSGADDPAVSRELTSGPWAENWTPRPWSPRGSAASDPGAREL